MPSRQSEASSMKVEDTHTELHSSEQPRVWIHGELTRGPWPCSHHRFPLSLSIFLLPLHLAEAVKTTETGESELGHALGWAGNAHQISVGKGRVEEWEARREREANWGYHSQNPWGSLRLLPVPSSKGVLPLNHSFSFPAMCGSGITLKESPVATCAVPQPSASPHLHTAAVGTRKRAGLKQSLDMTFHEGSSIPCVGGTRLST